MSETFPVIYLVRHGETAWSLTGQHTGLTDLPLTERGKRNARRLGERLAGMAFAKVLTSPLQRAARTCELAGFGAAVEVDHDLVEWNYGQYEGLRTVEIHAKHPDWQLFRDGCPDGESPDQVGVRADRVASRVRAIKGDVLIFSSSKNMNVLVIDIGGTHVKVLATGQDVQRQFASGPALTPRRMVSEVRKGVRDWKYDVVSIGYPGPVLQNRPVSEPWNLGKGWCGFNFARAFNRPVKVVNDAAMQALGSYKRGKMLFLGLGTGLGSALIADGIVEPMELGHLPYKKSTFEDYVGIRGLEKYGKKKWRRYVADVVKRLVAAIEPDEVVLGGGNVNKLKELPSGCRVGDNANAFVGGFRLWDKAAVGKNSARPKRRPKQLTRSRVSLGEATRTSV